MQLHDFQAHRHPQLGVQVRQRFVEQEHLGFAHDGAAHGHALALSAGQRARAAVQQVAEFQDLRGHIHALLDLVLGELADLQAVGHVLEHGHVRVERVVLEHHRDVALGGFQVVDDLVVNEDFAAGDGFQAGDHAHQRGFAAARRADDDDEFAVLDVHVDAMDDRHIAGVGFLDVTEAESSMSYSCSESCSGGRGRAGGTFSSPSRLKMKTPPWGAASRRRGVGVIFQCRPDP